MRPLSHLRTLAVLCGTLLAAACVDDTGTAPDVPAIAPPAPQMPTGGRTLAVYDCSADPRGRQVSCREQTGGSGGGASLAILGQNQVKLTSSNITVDSVNGIFGFDVTVKNLLAVDSIGTPDAQTVTGMKVYFETGPEVSAYVAPYDTGTVRMHNHDGTGHFTRANQPYFVYNEMLAPQQVSAVKRWEMYFSPSVYGFKFSVRVFAARSREIPVPVVAPDSIPWGIYDPARYVQTSTRVNGRFVRDVALVLFRETATPEERQAAVDAVNGRVLGGNRVGGDDGDYYVKVADDGTGTPLLNALDLLGGLPQVESATPEFILTPEEARDYQRPQDDLGGWRQWAVDPDGAAGSNWSHEAVAAPLAWGCTTGSAATKVAVVDQGFGDVTDILANVPDPGPAQVGAHGTSERHGTAVASVLAARGDNGTGMAGMMWNADLRLYERAEFRLGIGYIPMSANMRQISRAIADGARVINISFGLPWGGYISTSGVAPSTPQQKAQVEEFRDYYASRIKRRERRSDNRPLYVVSAGNEGIDAWWNGYPALKDDAELAPRVLVVGAAGNKPLVQVAGEYPRWGTLGGGSNHGTFVDLYAPGEGVEVLGLDGEPAPVNGTSVAAPMAAGAAGLLFSFDPRITAEQARDLLVRGGLAGTRYVNNVSGNAPLLNAYESLRLAAETLGAPLCGNLVWQDTLGNVRVRRKAGLEQQLFQWPGSRTDVLHGGSTIAIGAQWWGLQNGSWTGLGTQAAVASSASRSRAGQSHDGDSTVTVVRRQGADPQRQELWDVYLGGQAVATGIAGPAVNLVGSVNRCVIWQLSGTEWDSCLSEVPTWTNRITSDYKVALSPRNEIVLMVSTQKSSYTIDNARSYGGYFQRDHTLEVESNGTNVYFINRETGAVRPWTQAIYELRSMGLSDDGRTALFEKYNYLYVSTATPDETFVSNFGTCHVEYRNVNWSASPLTMGPVLQSLPLVRNRANCYGGATFAP